MTPMVAMLIIASMGHNIEKTVQDYLDDLDDIPTTPGNMCWVQCECLKREPCDICSNFGKVLTTVRTTEEKRCL